MALELVLGMKGGNGDSSYANNSSPQLKMIQAVKPILERGINENMRVKFGIGDIFRMADFGCGTGKNTLVVADTVVSAIQRLLADEEMPEFEVYFTDLPSNDFNSLFQMLPPPTDKNGVVTRPYLPAAVCGSHFTRLFSRKSLHFCHSSMSLHWLSQVPEFVQHRRSPRVYVSGDSEEGVADAYVEQFDRDLTAFLRGRAEEMVEGGCMFISLIGRNENTHIMEDQRALGHNARHLEYALQALVKEGIITEEKLESFNLPWFNPNTKEVEGIMKREGSFIIVSMKIVGDIHAHPISEIKRGEEKMFGRIVANQYRVLFENIVEAHLGCKRLTDKFFLKIAERASIEFEEYLSRKVELIGAFLKEKEDPITIVNK